MRIESPCSGTAFAQSAVSRSSLPNPAWRGHGAATFAGQRLEMTRPGGCILIDAERLCTQAAVVSGRFPTDGMGRSEPTARHSVSIDAVSSCLILRSETHEDHWVRDIHPRQNCRRVPERLTRREPRLPFSGILLGGPGPRWEIALAIGPIEVCDG